ncbi:hypothetical protein OV208_00815 [Corallococcus sp. bb12-1]|uniref:hypothetical protein n=1 Tax=Corallococcus sp. bb12-1 TaxID=2996784 RepID=UPI00226ECEC6|nr:hypothetical protein [Corallococcus sp. bb12-1]MCY1039841.1 hypothetical protein [Corallococcus sp. bb12-1]
MRNSKLWTCVAGALTFLSVGCGPEDGPEEAPASALMELDSCKGQNTLPDGGKYVVDNDWNTVGAQDQTGYTGIDSNKPNDQGVINAEKNAAAALDGGGCIYGAHGGNPATCGGQTSVQGLPNDTSQTIFHPEYHPECLGKPLILSVCFSGATGTGGYQPISSVIAGNYNVPPEQVVACTGSVSPGVPMKCYGTIVDGNGKPIGDQKIGGLDFVQTRGEPGPGDLVRCDPAQPCPVCTPDAGVDAGTDAGSDAGTDGGTRPDAGAGDAGTDGGSHTDAGVADAGVSDAGTDGGIHTDAGVADAGVSDAGTDGGIRPDAGVADAGVSDAGTDGGIRPDAGVGDAGGGTGFDAGVVVHDAGVILL